MTTSISWKRLSIEAAAIVISILLAFAIDAWWQDRQQQDADRTHLRGVLAELETHRVLIGEALKSHNASLAAGTRLLEITSGNYSDASLDEVARVVDSLLNNYEINAPFGSLQTAVASGAIARMGNTTLASALASWPTSIDDMLEEERHGANYVYFQFFPNLFDRISLATSFRLRLEAPTVRGVSGVVPGAVENLPVSPHEADFGPLFDNRSFENELMYLLMWAQASGSEALLFSGKLEELINELQACLDAHSC